MTARKIVEQTKAVIMQVMCTRCRSRRTAAHPIAIKHVLRPFRVAFTGGRSKTFILDVGYRIESADKIGWTPEWIKDPKIPPFARRSV
jgi:hypothetical protein